MLRPRGPRRAASLTLLTLALALAATSRGQEAAPAGAAPASADPTDTMARELVAKRAAVERLSSELDLRKAAQRDELRSVSQQQADVARQLKALELELADVRRLSGDRAAAIDSRQATRLTLKPLVLRHLTALRAHVVAALPFKVEERAAAVDELSRDLTADELAPDDALSRLWSSLEDELRLARESGLYRQRIELDGERQLVDVARLGTVLLFFRTLDGRFGLVLPAEAGAWRWTLARDEAERARIAALFAALDKHIRQGFFELPNPYAGATPAVERGR